MTCHADPVWLDASAPNETARCFAAFAPESIAHYLEHVWLGEPGPMDEPTLLDDTGRTIAIPVAELGQHRNVLLDAMVTLYGGERETHARALLSQWSKYYFGFAATAGFVAAAVLRRPLVMVPHTTYVVLRDGLPVALHLARDALRPFEENPAHLYAPLVEHLDTVISTLCAMTKIAPRVLWSNAGNLLDYLFEQCAPQYDLSRDAAWLFGPLDAAGEANPLRLPVRQAKPRAASLPNPFSARRVCCVRYEIPGETQLCGRCPLLLTMSDAQIALQAASA
ncbi:siderophore-iron reductase FhuF [Paraburkholderia sp. BCC1884]|uniref:siderophore-iron reductase FhuF n=1 Tax=Paraburkholderia sp. BCC1884 TaxID=2562668 RepID=UPI001181CF91|nr:siderophore-iron reductase FhuF [Paraburkholderia sp. BCC1884]